MTCWARSRSRSGPVTSEFSGKVHFVEQNRDEHRAVIDGKGKESRGTGNAAATVTAQLHDAGDRTRVTVDTDLKVVGKLAQFGSGMLQQVSEKLLGQFVESLEAKLAADNAARGTRPERRGAACGRRTEPAAVIRAHRPDPTRRWQRAQEVRSAGLRRLPVGGRRVHAGTAAHGAKGAAREAMTAPLLLRGVDLAAFAVALVNRLHTGGVVVSASGPAGFVEALQHDWPRTRLQLYWAARLTLVNRVEDLAAFDAVFEARIR